MLVIKIVLVIVVDLLIRNWVILFYSFYYYVMISSSLPNIVSIILPIYPRLQSMSSIFNYIIWRCILIIWYWVGLFLIMIMVGNYGWGIWCVAYRLFMGYRNMRLVGRRYLVVFIILLGWKLVISAGLCKLCNYMDVRYCS
jgi:hypothetical protein